MIENLTLAARAGVHAVALAGGALVAAWPVTLAAVAAGLYAWRRAR